MTGNGNKTSFNYLNIIQLSNNCGLLEFLLPEFSKFTYVHQFCKNAHFNAYQQC